MYSWLQASLQQLSQRAMKQSLHHALLLKGAKGIGKTEFAEQLGQFLLCVNKGVSAHTVAAKRHLAPCGHCQSCLLIAAGNHPDLYEIRSEKQIGVDAIREAIKKLSGSAQLSGAKILIIHDAHTMTESSANALLKTLEEPTNNTFLLLLSHQSERLLPTILSRCEKVALPSPTRQGCIDWLSAQGYSNVDDVMLRLYGTSPLELKEHLKSPPKVGYNEVVENIGYLSLGTLNAAVLATKWQDDAITIVQWLQVWLVEQLKTGPHNIDALWEMQKGCISANEQLRNPGVNKSLVLVNVLQSIAQR
ncbi:DNA polymerase III subunit delta' [Paraglaciecola mesophila]|uniref:DNA polymerase III subunit delta' n=1 Tax=Paraglaciecola mesophila TaxID=197222 RepID=UPI0013642543|nr:DNA polymerase III subunit delta' [Paraglaciecola mesophila]